MLKYKRISLKLSGEAMGGAQAVDFDKAEAIARQVARLHERGAEIGITIGGGNIWRGRSSGDMDRNRADQMGMLATVINSLAMQDAIEKRGIPTRVQTALTITRVAEPYILRKALSHLEKGRIVIFACGTGNPYFSTDTGAALRAAEIGADILLLAKNVDGIYDSDPKKNPAAKKIDRISHMEFIQQDLRAMDATAVTICMENKIPVLAFGLFEENSIVRAVEGQDIGTLIV